MGSRIHTVLVSVLLLALCACHAEPAGAKPVANAPQAAAPAPWYEPEIRAFEAADKAAPPRPGQVLFVGSSSIRLWSSLATDMAPAPVLNRGFGGSKTGDVLAVFDRIVLPYKPSVIVYYCGDNDLGTSNTDSQAAADGFIAFDRRARTQWPDLRVFYIPIKPSIQRWSNWAAMKKTNDIVHAYCARTPGATYLDTVSPTLTPEGRPDPSIFREDGLHMNAKGYAIWTSVIRPPVLEAWKKARK
jgi:lysophospholipase L1-like esterase